MGGAGIAKEKRASQTNLGGTGIFNADVEGYILDILHLSQSLRRKRQKSELLSEVSGAPETMHFAPDHRTSSSSGQRRRSGTSNRVKSWGSDDIDFGPRGQRGSERGHEERSLTPEPQTERLYASPEHMKKGMRRFTMSNVIQKVSPNFRKKRYKVAASSSELVASGNNRSASPLHEVREMPKKTSQQLPEEERDGESGGGGEKAREREEEGERGEGEEKAREKEGEREEERGKEGEKEM